MRSFQADRVDRIGNGSDALILPNGQSVQP
jgi:hypothetical protein